MLVFSLAASICIDWQLSVIFLAFIPVLGVGLYPGGQPRASDF